MSKLLLLTDEEARLIDQAIEAWTAVYAGDGEFELHRVDRFNVKRKLDSKYTDAEREEIAQAALRLID